MVVHLLSSAPGSPAEGQVYYDTVLKTLLVYNSSTWLDVGTGQPFVWNGSSYVLLSGQKIYLGTGTPGSPANGDIWFDTTGL